MKRIISLFLAVFCIGILATGCGSTTKANKTDETMGAHLVGSWEDVQKGSIMEFTKDGKFSGRREEGTYELIEENKIKLKVGNNEPIEVSFEINGDTLKWGTNFDEFQEFKRYKEEKTNSQDNAQDNVYVNKDYSFQFTLPNEWVENCKIVENANSEYTNAKFEVDFLYVPKNKENQSEDMQTLLTIYVVTKDDWAEMDKNKEQEPPFGAYLGEKDDLVYLFSTPQSNPYGSETELGKIFDRMPRTLVTSVVS
jgi:hypothetical protein